MEGINHKSDIEMLDEKGVKLITNFKKVSDRMLAIMNSDTFSLHVGDPDSEYEKLKLEHNTLLEEISKNHQTMAGISKNA